MTSDERTPLISRTLERWLAALLVLVIAVFVGLFVARRASPAPVRTANAVGDSTCISCHRDKASFEGTAHRLTSRWPTRASIEGSFHSGQNLLRTANPSLYYRLDSTSAGFVQTAVIGKAPDTTTRTERIAIVAGSGRKGQSFLYWRAHDQLFQLPVSWWTSLSRWIYSPGPAYPDGSLNFDRTISPRCLECHATWIESVADPKMENRYKPESAILGITCERCHASGQEHVEHERSVLHVVRAPAIVNPSRLSRARKIEMCAQCHAGLGEPKAPAFTYVGGKPLHDYLELPPLPYDAPVDVHGNQVGLLARSKCYRSSQMTCATCHDVHAQQRDVTQISGRCLTCHQVNSCGLFPQRGNALVGRCVDCHMPLQSSNVIVSALEGKFERPQVRSHWIRVYPGSASH
jgi:hypothetical protein